MLPDCEHVPVVPSMYSWPVMVLPVTETSPLSITRISRSHWLLLVAFAVPFSFSLMCPADLHFEIVAVVLFTITMFTLLSLAAFNAVVQLAMVPFAAPSMRIRPAAWFPLTVTFADGAKPKIALN